MPTVQQIHSEVFGAQDELLKEAQRIIDTPIHQDMEESIRMQQLNELGFGKCKEVKKHTQASETLEKALKLKELVKHYALVYPLNRFISHDKVMEICKKYNLLLADAKNYTGDIPEKNQREIIQFRVRKCDIESSWMDSWMSNELPGFMDHRLRRSYPATVSESYARPLRSDIIHTPSILDIANSMSMNTMKLQRIFLPPPVRIRTDWRVASDQYATERDALYAREDNHAGFMGLIPQIETQGLVCEYNGRTTEADSSQMVPAKGIKIIAPESMLDMESNGNHRRGYILVDDPIPMQPVKGGYLIITAWGKEASDPDVVNSIHN